MKSLKESKKSLFAVFMALLCIFSISFAACDDDEKDSDDPTEENNNDDDDAADAALTYEDGETLEGSITKSVTVVEGATITLKGTVIIKDGATLTVNKGVTVKADTSTLSYLIIERGAKIVAEGTAEAPITFTSGKDEGSRTAKDWGGIIINGKATINTGTEASGEGDSGLYGGSDDADSSGSLKYVRVMFSGYPFSSTNELNGLCLQGVGSGTTIDYIQLHSGADDGIEMFGGTVKISHIVSTCNEDDQIDCTAGWRGSIEYGIGASLTASHDSGMEYDNNEANYAQTPVTNVSHKYMTVIARGAGADGKNGKGARMRRGTIAVFENSYFATLASAVDENVLVSECTGTSVTVKNSSFQGATAGYKQSSEVVNGVDMGKGTFTQENYAAASALTIANITPANLAAQGSALFVTAGSNGAITDANSNWAAGWTAFPVN